MKDRKAIQFPQLCAIVRTILTQEPSIDDAEWKARTHETLAKWGFLPAPADMLVRAMTQVEHALRNTVGPRLERPIPHAPMPVIPQPEIPIKPGRTNRPVGWDIVVGLMAQMRKPTASAPSSPKPSGPKETLELSEPEAINEFYRQVNEGADKILLLKAFAEIALVRPADWDYQEVRARSREHRLCAEHCFVCRNEVQHWHHIIQIQHGGSNYVRNFVGLCEACHGAVHPWLPQVMQRGDGWASLKDIAPTAVDAMIKRAARA